MWRVVYRELRANDATLALNPMQLNDIYDHLWDVGTLLTSEDRTKPPISQVLYTLSILIPTKTRPQSARPYPKLLL
jgi:hypothetical protein